MSNIKCIQTYTQIKKSQIYRLFTVEKEKIKKNLPQLLDSLFYLWGYFISNVIESKNLKIDC